MVLRNSTPISAENTTTLRYVMGSRKKPAMTTARMK